MASVTVQQNPIPDTSVVQPPLAQFSGGGAYGAISTTGGPYGVAQLGVDPNELTAYQLNQLYGGDSPIAHQAAQNAQQMALARGAGLSGSLYADTATQAALDSLAPIAQQDAGVYANTALANQDALNKAMLQRMQGDYSVRVAGIQAGPDACRTASGSWRTRIPPRGPTCAAPRSTPSCRRCSRTRHSGVTRRAAWGCSTPTAPTSTACCRACSRSITQLTNKATR